MNLRTNLFELSLKFSSYLRDPTDYTISYLVGFSIKELGMSEEAQGLEYGPTVTFFLEVSNTEQSPGNLLHLKVGGKIA